MAEITLPNAIAMMRAAIEEVTGLSPSLTPLSFASGVMSMPDVDCTSFALSIPTSTNTKRTPGRTKITGQHNVQVTFAVAAHEESAALLAAVAVEQTIIVAMMRRDLMWDAVNGSLEVAYVGTNRPIIGGQYLMTHINFAVIAEQAVIYRAP